MGNLLGYWGKRFGFFTAERWLNLAVGNLLGYWGKRFGFFTAERWLNLAVGNLLGIGESVLVSSPQSGG